MKSIQTSHATPIPPKQPAAPRTWSRRQWLATAGAAGLALTACPLLAAAPEDSAPMILIPAGPFRLGTSAEEAAALARQWRCHVTWFNGELPQRTLELPAFRIDQYPVTNRLYAVFVAATGHPAPSHWRGPTPPPDLLDHPVVFVSRADATAYAKWAGKRLPSAAEWEKAARGPDGLQYPWGNRFDKRACHHDRGGARPPSGTAPVTAHPRGASPYGVMDLAGNVAEWCADGPGGGSGYLKGGCWLSSSPLTLRCAALGLSGFTNNQLDYIGFRCAQTA